MTVVYLSDRSCANFRAKIFAFRTSANFASGFFNSILSGTGAIASLASGPAGAGLAAANLATGNALNGINTSYYANKMIDQLDAEMEALRVAKKSQILTRVQAPDICSPENDKQPCDYLGVDAEIDLQGYDSLCSLESLSRPTGTPTPTVTPTPTPTAAPTPILKVTIDPKNLTGKFAGAGSSPGTTTVRVENPKDNGVAVTVSDLILSDNTHFAMTTTTCKGTALQPNGSCSDKVTFTPTSLNKVDGDLTIKSDAVGADATVKLPGRIQDVPPTADVTSLTFPKAGGEQTFNLKNSDLVLTVKVTKMLPVEGFKLTQPPGVPFTIPSNTSMPITIKYTPQDKPVAKNAHLTIEVDSAKGHLPPINLKVSQ